MKKNKKSRQNRPLSLPLLVIILGFTLGLLFAEYTKDGHLQYEAEGILWPSPPKLNEFFLVDSKNRPFTLADFKGKWSIIFFGFTNCPDICPSTLMEMSKAEKELRSIPEFGASGQLVFISVDPDRDTPEILNTYISHFSANIRAITGVYKELEILTKSLGAIFLRVETGDKNYSVDHSAGLFFISPDATLFTVLTPPIIDRDISSRLNNVIRAYRKVAE